MNWCGLIFHTELPLPPINRRKASRVNGTAVHMRASAPLAGRCSSVALPLLALKSDRPCGSRPLAQQASNRGPTNALIHGVGAGALWCQTRALCWRRPRGELLPSQGDLTVAPVASQLCRRSCRPSTPSGV